MIGVQVILGHARKREAFFENAVTAKSVEDANVFYGIDGLLFIVDDEAGNAVIDDFGNGAATPGDDRCSACHSLDHREPKGLGPVNHKEQCQGVSEEIWLLGFIDFADEFNEWVIEHGLDYVVEVGSIVFANFCGNFERDVGLNSDIDGRIKTFFGGDSA